jgi:PAS domain S-box-containing protein
MIKQMESPNAAKLLIIGPKGSDRSILINCLREAGHRLGEAKTGTEGLARIAAESPELVVVDLDLPDIGGLEVCRRIKSRPQSATVPVILLSSVFAKSSRRVEGLEAGADKCLAEPIEPGELLAQVKAILRGRRIELALRESEERFRLATEAMNGLVYEWDIAANVTRRSAGMAEFLGWTADEVTADSRWWPEQIHPDDVQAVQHHFAAAVARRAPACGHEYRIRHKDGHYFWIWDSNRIIYGPDEKPVRVIGCTVSIDERKQAEEELRSAKDALAHLNEDLEDKVEERTARLLEMVAELESWSYSIAHDMRAPLRSMHNFSGFLLHDYGPQLDPIASDYLQRIRVAAQRMDAYINDLLDYGKVGRGRFPLETVNTEQLIVEILDTYPNLQSPKCSIEVQRPLPPVKANASALTQVFSNLLGNAVKFVKPDVVPKVRVWADQKGPWVRLWVEDNGIGITKSAQSRVFGMFQRLHPASAYEGTGIGLAIVRRAVERMGGTVGLESEPNRGSRFWVELMA